VADTWKLFELERLDDPALVSFYGQFLDYALSASSALRNESSTAFATTVTAAYCVERTFNARASFSDGNYLVLLNVAVPCLTHFCFNNLLRLSFVLPWVGNASQEEQYAVFRRGIPGALEVDATLDEALKILPSVSRPHDNARALAASALTEIACIFCAFHEIAHLAGGHAAYASVHFAGEAVSEFYGWLQTRRRKRAALRRVWEFEADKLATVMLMNYLLNGAPTQQHYRECFMLSSDGTAFLKELLAQALLAVALLFRYLGQQRRKMDRRSFHPHPLVRSVCVHGTMRIVALHQFKVDIGDLDKELDTAVYQVERAFTDWKTPHRASKYDESRLWEAVQEQILELENDHQRLQPTYQSGAWIPATYWRPLSLG
jgi:hypothetical protein